MENWFILNNHFRCLYLDNPVKYCVRYVPSSHPALTLSNQQNKLQSRAAELCASCSKHRVKIEMLGSNRPSWCTGQPLTVPRSSSAIKTRSMWKLRTLRAGRRWKRAEMGLRMIRVLSGEAALHIRDESCRPLWSSASRTRLQTGRQT